MKIYCTSCGAPNLYEALSSKPKFCSGCGLSFSPIAKVSPTTPVITPKRKKKEPEPVDEETEGEDEDAYAELPNINKLDIEIDTGPSKGVKLGDLAVNSGGETFTQEKYEQGTRASKEELLESIKREAGFYPSKNHEMNE